MKSQHRHELETNWLAHRMARVLDDVRPYNSLIAGTLLALAALIFGYSYFSGASAARQSEAWNSYNQAVESMPPNLAVLRESAQEYPDSPMQQWADITWADGQVWTASRQFVQNRPAAIAALNLASSTYQSLLRETDDERVVGRAHFGLAHVYELRDELDKAREEYRAVTGGFARLAEQRAKELEDPTVKDACTWLATAEGPRRTLPAGGGFPGERPDFAPGDLEIPDGGTDSADEATPSVDELFQDLGPPELPQDAAEGADAADATATPGDAKSNDVPAGDASSPQD